MCIRFYLNEAEGSPLVNQSQATINQVCNLCMSTSAESNSRIIAICIGNLRVVLVKPFFILGFLSLNNVEKGHL